MYLIVQLCEKGYKVRYASNNLEEIYKNYDILIKISPNNISFKCSDLKLGFL